MIFDESKHPRADDGKFTEGKGDADKIRLKLLLFISHKPLRIINSYQSYDKFRSRVFG